MLARIYRPSKTAMQSGKAGTDRWVLDYELETRPTADPLMGYTSSADMRRQVRLAFASVEEAKAYAERNGIPYRVSEDRARTVKPMAYADNFRFNRTQPWTH